MKQHDPQIEQSIHFNGITPTVKTDRLYKQSGDLRYNGKRLLDTDDDVGGGGGIDNTLLNWFGITDTLSAPLTNTFAQPFWGPEFAQLNLPSAGWWRITGQALVVVTTESADFLENVHCKFHYSGSAFTTLLGYQIQSVLMQNTGYVPEQFGGVNIFWTAHITVSGVALIPGNRTLILQLMRTGSAGTIKVRSGGTLITAIHAT